MGATDSTFTLRLGTGEEVEVDVDQVVDLEDVGDGTWSCDCGDLIVFGPYVEVADTSFGLELRASGRVRVTDLIECATQLGLLDREEEVEAFAVWANHLGEDWEHTDFKAVRRMVEGGLSGVYESYEAYGEELLGEIVTGDMFHRLRHFIDFERFGEEESAAYTVLDTDDRLFFFSE